MKADDLVDLACAVGCHGDNPRGQILTDMRTIYRFGEKVYASGLREVIAAYLEQPGRAEDDFVRMLREREAAALNGEIKAPLYSS
jgi:hypothetical protein